MAADRANTTHSSPFSEDEVRTIVRDGIELGVGNEASLSFEDESDGVLNVSGGWVNLHPSYDQDFQVVEGMVLNEMNIVIEELGARRVLIELECIETAENVREGNSYDFDRQCRYDWSGVPEEFQDRAHGQFAWTFTQANDLYVCLATSSSENAARNATIVDSALASGCNGATWRKMTPTTY